MVAGVARVPGAAGRPAELRRFASAVSPLKAGAVSLAMSKLYMRPVLPGGRTSPLPRGVGPAHRARVAGTPSRISPGSPREQARIEWPREIGRQRLVLLAADRNILLSRIRKPRFNSLGKSDRHSMDHRVAGAAPSWYDLAW